MADPATFNPILTAVPVIVGGALAIAGGLASQFAIHRLAERREVAKLRRERIESLVKAVYAQTRWISELSRKMVFRNEDHDEPWPLDDAMMIQDLYFPELKAEVHAVLIACLPMTKFIGEQRVKHMRDRDTFIREYDPTVFDEAYKKYLLAVSALTERCRALLSE